MIGKIKASLFIFCLCLLGVSPLVIQLSLAYLGWWIPMAIIVLFFYLLSQPTNNGYGWSDLAVETFFIIYFYILSLILIIERIIFIGGFNV